MWVKSWALLYTQKNLYFSQRTPEGHALPTSDPETGPLQNSKGELISTVQATVG